MMRLLCVNATILGGVLAAGLLVATTARNAEARPLYFKWWMTEYKSVAEANDVAKKVKCNVCHYGSKKSNRNAYGKAISKALGSKKNIKAADKEIFMAALQKAEKEKSEVDGKTFGDLLKDKQLPATQK